MKLLFHFVMHKACEKAFNDIQVVLTSPTVPYVWSQLSRPFRAQI